MGSGFHGLPWWQLWGLSAQPSVLDEEAGVEGVSGRGSDFYQLCRDLDSSLSPDPGAPGPRPMEAQPWVEPGYWEALPPRSSSILEEACRQFQDTLQECHDLDRQARDSLAQAMRALSPAGATAASFVF